MIQPAGPGAPPEVGYVTLDRPARPGLGKPMEGEALRARRDPSVSELMARRAAQIAGSGPAETIPDVKLQRASDLALLFISWDETASLPTVKRLMKTSIERSLDVQQENQNEGYARYIAAFAIVRARRRPRGPRRVRRVDQGGQAEEA